MSCSSVRRAKVFLFVHRLTLGFPYANHIHSVFALGKICNELDLLRIPLVGHVLRDMLGGAFESMASHGIKFSNHLVLVH